MKRIIRERLAKAKRRIERRLRPIRWSEQPRPMLSASNIQYEVADRGRGLAAGGIGAMHLVAQRSGLVEMIDKCIHVLKRHIPYHESDHVLKVAYNLLCGGTRIEHIEHRRNHRRVQAGDGHRLQRPVGLSPVGDFLGQHRRAVVPGQPQR